jgi:two-component system phosphate regulon sensor histidine kinase PhoR
MKRKKLIWRIFPYFLLVIVLSLVAVSWYASRSMKQFYLDHLARDLEERGRLLERDTRDMLVGREYDAIKMMCKDLGGRVSNRITVILPDGVVVGDSEEDPSVMDNHKGRPEIRKALGGQVGSSIRFSRTLKKDMMYVAMPVLLENEVIGVLRTSLPVVSIRNALGVVYGRIALGGFVVVILTAFISLWMASRISRPLQAMRQGAERFARGELQHKLPLQGAEELTGLADAMNQMARQLDDRIRTIISQRNEQETILSSMMEGILAVDTKERLLTMNQAAANLLGVALEESEGRSIQEVVRNTDLQRFVGKVLFNSEPVEDDIVLYNGDEKYIQVHGTILRDSKGQSIGGLVVMNDVTRLRRLENVRREFVANVSHELKTPITAIQGFVETLLDGAVGDPKDARRFLKIMQKQVDRLNAIIEDLLSLSRIEKQAEKGEIVLKRGRVRDVMEAAIQICEVKSESKKIGINLICPADLYLKINALLLEQAVTNLIDNAIKYSDEGSTIQLEVIRGDMEVIIHVRDRGCGIEKEHLTRIFERFYSVNKGKNGKLNGTGLGLAIVKHVAQAHGGYASAESTPGEGSIFSIHLPIA